MYSFKLSVVHFFVFIIKSFGNNGTDSALMILDLTYDIVIILSVLTYIIVDTVKKTTCYWLVITGDWKRTKVSELSLIKRKI